MGFIQIQYVSLTLVCAGVAVLAKCIYSLLMTGRRSGDLPPGPPTVPLFGNELQIPKTDGHFKLSAWAREYGGIYSLKRFDSTMIVVTDRKLVKELFDKRSNVYSHRPQSPVTHLITDSEHLLFMQYGERWRQLRKMVHQYFTEARCEKDHWKLQEAEAQQMLHDFLAAPQDHMLHPRRYSNSIANSLVYGIRTKTVRDEYMKRFFYHMEKWSQALELGAAPPIDLLNWLPESITGRWKPRAIEVRGLMKSLYQDVLSQVRRRRERGVYRGSFMDTVLDTLKTLSMGENELEFFGGVLMEGGSDTSSSLILTIIQAMTKFPHVQAKAHAEIDAAFGSDRSPRWSDFSKLPYINCIIKEAHRWRPVNPLGVPHATSKDDYFNGMFIPKDSVVMLNVWGMHHDPELWNAPELFEPDRYLKHTALAPSYAASSEWELRDHYGYGAGRRICAGMHLAERNLFIAVAKLLWAFEFTQPAGTESDISAESGTRPGIVRCPKDFSLGVRVRSPEKEKTIFKEYEQAQAVFANYD